MGKVILIFGLVALAASQAAYLVAANAFMGPLNQPLMKTNINLVGADQSNMKTNQANNVVIDTNKIYTQAALANSAIDIEEDETDPFITTGSGKPRPTFKTGLDAKEWEFDMPERVNVHSRVKRCGGGGGGDDDGDANRARRARRRRAQRRRAAKAKKAARKAAKTQTTVTRKVIQNGQVVSETSHEAGAVQQVVAAPQQQPVIVQQTPPVPATIQTIPAQPATVQTIPAQTAAVQQAPAQVVAAPATVPSVNVQSSVKINA